MLTAAPAISASIRAMMPGRTLMILGLGHWGRSSIHAAGETSIRSTDIEGAQGVAQSQAFPKSPRLSSLLMESPAPFLHPAFAAGGAGGSWRPRDRQTQTITVIPPMNPTR